MSSPSQQLAERYGLDLTSTWRAWFDGECSSLVLPGMMRQPLEAAELSRTVPEHVWPGFMLPDTLPVLGNKYGDWICARVTGENQLGELVYWYHGGGDWIPVGANIAEAVLHDAVDQFRTVRKQMLRGASESRLDSQGNVLMRLDTQDVRKWLCQNLSDVTGCDTPSALASVIDLLSQEKHGAALKMLAQNRWAEDAVSCDLVELYLQKPVEMIANQQVAQAAEIPWYPDFVRLLFDTDTVPEDSRARIMEACDWRVTEWPQQDWEAAGSVAEQVVTRRRDLGWAVAICGWRHERNQAFAQAARTYADGLRASSFADQSVRFNCHAESEEHGKFSAARLLQLKEHWPNELRDDSYLQLFSGGHQRSLLVEISEYWKQRALERERAGGYGDAYRLYYACGWDMGVSRIDEYAEILAALRRCARRANWKARAAVAEMHLACLSKQNG